MDKEATSPFNNILDNFLDAKKKFHKKRLIERLEIQIPIFIEVGSRIYDANIIDVSSNVIRIDHEFALADKSSCVITFKTQPAIQVIGNPIIQEQEFTKGKWNRLSLKTSLNLRHLFQSLTKK